MVVPFSSGRISRSMVRIPGSGSSEDAGLLCLNLGNVSSYAARVPVPQTLSFVSRSGREVTSPVTSSLGSANADSVTSTKMDDGKPTSLSNCDAIRDVLNTTDDLLPQEGSGRHEESSHVLRESSQARTNARWQSMVARSQEGVNGLSARRKRPLRGESSEEPESGVVSKRHRLESKPNGSSMRTWPTQVGSSGYVTANGAGQPVFLTLAPSSGSSTAVPTLTTQTNNGNLPIFVFQAMPGQGVAYQEIPTHAMALQQVPQARDAHRIVAKRDLKNYLEQMLRQRNQLKMENASLKHRLSCFQQLLKNKQKLNTVIRHLHGTPAPVPS